jgi:hypothetical protein
MEVAIRLDLGVRDRIEPLAVGVGRPEIPIPDQDVREFLRRFRETKGGLGLLVAGLRKPLRQVVEGIVPDVDLRLEGCLGGFLEALNQLFEALPRGAAS